jgi:GDP-L-fucose synthase
MFANQRVLVTGGTGMIGRFLVDLLLKQGAKVRIVSRDHVSRAHPDADFLNADLTDMATCVSVCEGMDYVFHLVGVKGSPKMTKEKPASFFVPVLRFNTHMMEAARLAKVKWYLYTSTVGVYQPAEILREDDVWKTLPSPNDWFSGWAKRMGELQAEAYRIEYGWDTFSIVRPANVYGPYDNYDLDTGMVIPSLIRRTVEGENPLRVWGDGTPIRDFIHAHDVARGMLFVVENQIREPLNLGSGVGTSVQEVVDIILSNLDSKPEVVWDPSKPSGDKKRLLDMSRAKAHGFEPVIPIEQGIADTMKWYRSHQRLAGERYSVFGTG